MSSFQYMTVTPSKSEGQHLVDSAQASSKSFVRYHKNANHDGMVAQSNQGWSTLLELFVFLRNEEDAGRIPSTRMQAATAKIIKKTTAGVVNQAVNGKKLPKGIGKSDASLREALNKIAHKNMLMSTFRVARTGAHYLILSGPEQNPLNGFWVIEIHMSTLFKRCREAMA